MATPPDDLVAWLEASLAGPVVSRFDLPPEHVLHGVHAQLAGGIRQQRRFFCVEVKDDDSTGDNAE